jgi:hypothetical protein
MLCELCEPLLIVLGPADEGETAGPVAGASKGAKGPETGMGATGSGAEAGLSCSDGAGAGARKPQPSSITALHHRSTSTTLMLYM